ncbi:unnamed protein product [Caenorhabditis auriculariae]|uniref:Protein-tyrosine-phosphatase n=1 Tax=Caenorhabditis auriculariae TaxID=2777116 RepID=A0A8S1HB63_9PELO|nr:unnamed protein product [Caenorhabditis auriculariae]
MSTARATMGLDVTSILQIFIGLFVACTFALCQGKKKESSATSRGRGTALSLSTPAPPPSTTPATPAGTEKPSILSTSPSNPKNESKASAITPSSKLSQASKETQKEKPKSEPKSSDKTDNRALWVSKITKRKCKEISLEHKEKLKGYAAPGKTYKVHDANPLKNRYTDVLCIDSTRVILKNRKEDYIHASWITMPDKSCSYICTQGPLPETIADFWAMIHQEKPKFVIMLCNLVEGGGQKCALYYPEKVGTKENYDGFEVHFVEEKPEPVEGVVCNVLHVTHKGEQHELLHLIVPWWPDQLAPADAKPMKTNPKNAPIVVHCSAGVGRTATFVGIDYANVRLQEEPNLDLIDIVKEMRAMRYQAIQSHVQYLFLHVCLLEYFIQESFVRRDAPIEQFIEQYKMHALKKLEKRRGEDDENHDRQKADDEKEREKKRHSTK